MPPSQTFVAVSAEYRASGYTVDNEEWLRSALSEIGYVRARALRMPEAGGATDVWLVIEAFGISIASSIAYDLVKRAVPIIRRWMAGPATRLGPEPELSSVGFGFDDLRVTFSMMENADNPSTLDSEALLHLPGLLQEVGHRFTAEMMARHEVQYLDVQIFAETPEGATRVPARRWIVGLGAPFPTHYYWLSDRRFTPLERGDSQPTAPDQSGVEQ